MELSVVIVTYNSQDTIFDCLNSIFIQKKSDIEIIAVDNSSRDNTIGIIKKNFPEVILACNEKNLGYSAAVNKGIRQTKGRYVLILNADVILEENFIRKSSAQIKQLPKETGMISPKIMAGENRIDSLGLEITKLRRLHDIGRGRVNGGCFRNSKPVFGPCGACGLYSREMLENIKIGNEYFDEDFFLLVEDFDLAWRANSLGWKGECRPELVCFHQGGISRNKSKLGQYYIFRNRYLLLIKNESVWGLVRLILLAWIYDLPRLIYLLCVNKYTRRALREIIGLLPAVIRKRRIVQAKIKSVEWCI